MRSTLLISLTDTPHPHFPTEWLFTPNYALEHPLPLTLPDRVRTMPFAYIQGTPCLPWASDLMLPLLAGGDCLTPLITHMDLHHSLLSEGCPITSVPPQRPPVPLGSGGTSFLLYFPRCGILHPWDPK